MAHEIISVYTKCLIMNFKKIYFAIGIVSFVFAFQSCEKLLMPDDPECSATAVFDYLWTKVDEQYSMFDVKGVDWDAVYDSLRPKVYDGMGDDSLFAVCATMLRTLNDGHVNLINAHDVAHADSLYYDFYAEDDIDINAVVLGYLGTSFHTTGGIQHGGLADGRVIYMRYSSFSNSISVSQLKYIIKSYPDAQGMILDLRGNGGGNLANVDHLLRIMPSHGQVISYSQIKSGPGHDDFTPLVETYAPKTTDSDAFDLPVYVLVDRGCFSATSSFAIATMAYDNMTLLGDTTGGGLGLPFSGLLPNGWRYRFSITRTLAIDKKNYENGVPPDIYLRLDRQAALTEHKDNIIDKAVSLIISNL